MPRVEQYRQLAASCLRLARQAKNTTERDTLIQMARAWHNLIANLEMEPHANVSEPPPAAQQQQQQQQQTRPKQSD